MLSRFQRHVCPMKHVTLNGTEPMVRCNACNRASNEYWSCGRCGTRLCVGCQPHNMRFCECRIEPTTPFGEAERRECGICGSTWCSHSMAGPQFLRCAKGGICRKCAREPAVVGPPQDSAPAGVIRKLSELDQIAKKSISRSELVTFMRSMYHSG
jgi:hypothetical protein